MAADPNSALPRVLMETVQSEEPEVLRERCLEILRIMAASGHASAIAVLEELRASANV
jgi:hypothetical protein